MFTTLYNVDVEDEFRQRFTIRKGKGVLNYWIWIFGAIILSFVLVGLVLFVFRKKDRRNKRARVLKKYNYQTGKTNMVKDRMHKAMAPGKRVSRRGNIYYETRSNRSDKDGKMSFGKKI